MGAAGEDEGAGGLVGAAGGLEGGGGGEDLGYVARLRERGATTQGEVRDVGGGKLVVTVTDADGNVFGLSQES